MNFKELGLSDETVRAIEEKGIAEPTTVQTDVIPSILQGKDIFTIAPQGCGKTSSYVFPLIDIMARKKGQTILILTADSRISAAVSDEIATFNRYHSHENDDENSTDEANVIIATPDLLLDWQKEENIDLASTSILVVDDINLIKKKKQLKNLEKILEMLPAEKQNIVYTNRRSQETQGILEKILKSPQEIKVDKAKEQEANNIAPESPAVKEQKKNAGRNIHTPQVDREAKDLIRKYNTFAGKTPEFLTLKGVVASEED